jgi:putative ABC transport system permease protein
VFRYFHVFRSFPPIAYNSSPEDMNISTLVKRNLRHFWRTNLAVVLGVATAVAVLAGALLVGDSVRASLRDLAIGRLGKTDLLIASTGFFREALAGEMAADAGFSANLNAACPMIAIEGVVTRDENNARAGGVQVYGVDERFWNFHGASAPVGESNDAFLSQSLARDLGAKPGETIVLRLEKPSLIPVESLHGRKDELGVTVRFTMREALPPGGVGEFSLRPQQGDVRAMFVPLARLQRNLNQAGKVNTILLSAKNEQAATSARVILKKTYALADLGFKLRVLEAQQRISFETDSGVISRSVAQKVHTAAEQTKFKASDYSTYLANSIRLGDRTIPYSLITGVRLDSFSEFIPETFAAGGDVGTADEDGEFTPSGALTLIRTIDGKRVELRSPAIPYSAFVILNEWAARDLQAKIGDRVYVDYYYWENDGRLSTKTAEFLVAGTTPIKGLAADRDLAPEYPGITEAKSLSDWDPPFPVDLSRVRKIDEEYWDQYRTTPKAFIPIDAARKLWGTRYGKITSIRIDPETLGNTELLEQVKTSFEKRLLDTLDPVNEGMLLQPVRSESLQASRGATDFGEYFTYFSFFLVISALMLATLFFKLGVEQRLREIGLLRAVGLSITQIRSLFLREGLALAVVGSLVGVLAAMAYGGLMMWGLRTWWVDAVGSTALRLHVTPLSLAIGAAGGIIAAVVCIWWTLRKLARQSPRGLIFGVAEPVEAPGAAQKRKRPLSLWLALLFGVAGIALLAAGALKAIGQAGGFFGAGSLMLVAILFLWSGWLRSGRKQIIAGNGLRAMAQMGFRNASTRPGRSVLCIGLIASAAFIIVSVDAFRRDQGAETFSRESGDGGYPLMAESLLPIVHNPNSEAGRDELNLTDDALRNVTLDRFRLRPGDDASCLNLYQPRNPRILGATEEFIAARRFAFQSSLAADAKQKINPWELLNQEPQTPAAPPVIPVIADANSMTYVLHAKLGDEISLNASDGSPIRLRLVAALADSVFQGELIMAEKNFLKYFPDQEGYRVFLIDCPPQNGQAVAASLESRLSDFGFDVSGTRERLAGFHRVENTYLSTFQTLGGLGLLLGVIGMGAVLLRNVLERRREIALMRAVGYQPADLSFIVIAENAFLLGCGLVTGVFCAILAIIPALIARSGGPSVASLGLLILAVLATGLAASVIAVRAVVRSPLIPALRSE